MFVAFLLGLLAVFAVIGLDVGRRRTGRGAGIGGAWVLGTWIAFALPLGVGLLHALIVGNHDGTAIYAGFAAAVASYSAFGAWSIGLVIGARIGRRRRSTGA